MKYQSWFTFSDTSNKSVFEKSQESIFVEILNNEKSRDVLFVFF